MRVTVVGAGAIGSLLSARLARSGCDVSLLVRETAEVGRQNVINLIDDTGNQAVAVRTESAAAALDVQDVVVLAVKAHAIAGCLLQIAPLMTPDTILITAVNGVPWWFFDGHPTEQRLVSVDRDGSIVNTLKHQQLVGCVLFPAAQIVSPNIVRHLSGNRIIFGNPRRGDVQAATAAALFVSAGFDTPVVPDIRAALWAKLVGNAAVNPLSVITGATIKHMAEDPDLAAILTRAMAEIDAVGTAIGIAPMMAQDERLKLAASVGHHKTSMLQDFEAGRALELSPLIGAVREIARRKVIATPVLDTFHHLIAAKLSMSASTT